MSDLLINPYRFGVAFTPASITGLAAWWKADSYVGSDGDLVSTWADSSGNSKDATATTTLRPTYQTNELNGQPVMRFDGNDGMITPAIDLSAVDDVTVFAVFTAASGGDQVVFEMSTNYSSLTDSFLVYRAAANGVAMVMRSTNYSVFETTGTLTTTAKVYVGTADRALATNEVAGWLNGDGAGSRALNNNLSGNFGNRACYIGARAQAGLFLTGDIAEMGIYNSALGTTDRDNLETYLGAKYGITVA